MPLLVGASLAIVIDGVAIVVGVDGVCCWCNHPWFKPFWQRNRVSDYSHANVIDHVCVGPLRFMTACQLREVQT